MNTILADPNPADAAVRHRAGKDEISTALQFVIFFAAFLVIASRRPDALWHAQFYGEDGAIWFADAYNWGPWKALFWTFHGYIQVFPRLAAALAVAAPVAYAPWWRIS